MGLLSFAREWNSNWSQLNDSDRMITKIVGINPKGYHPTVYRGAIDFAKDTEEKYTKVGGPTFCAAELAATRIAFMAGIANNAEDFASAQKYVNAYGQIKRSCFKDIRQALVWELDEICTELKVSDSNPNGLPMS